MSQDAIVKSELIDRFAITMGISEQEAKRLVDSLLGKLASHLSEGGRIEMRGFGSFSVRWRQSRIAHNPRTRSRERTQDKWAPYFRSGLKLRDRVNNAFLEKIGQSLTEPLSEEQTV